MRRVKILPPTYAQLTDIKLQATHIFTFYTQILMPHLHTDIYLLWVKVVQYIGK